MAPSTSRGLRRIVILTSSGDQLMKEHRAIIISFAGKAKKLTNTVSSVARIGVLPFGDAEILPLVVEAMNYFVARTGGDSAYPGPKNRSF